MAANTGEDHVDDPAIQQTPIPLIEGTTPGAGEDEIIQTNNPEIINPTPETNNMEVHHHTHADHGKKNWKSYLWEFLMLFLAVFCGFLAEYQLEHKIEKDRAAELAESFYAELKIDSAAVKSTIRFSYTKVSAIQYLVNYFRDSSFKNISKEFAYNYGMGLLVNRPAVFEPRGAILELLINSGSLRYFKSKDLQKMTIDLSIALKEIKARNERLNQYVAENIDPFIIKHNDEQWYHQVVLQFKGGFRQYLNSNVLIPFHFNNAEKLDKVEDINRIGFFSAILGQNVGFYYQKYDSLNAKLISELKIEYRLD